jgi:uncharacterized glyoxalase superfamily protein PhnB
MKNDFVPQGYNTVMPYLILKNAIGFAEFVEKVFDGKENKEIRHMRNETTIMHGQIKIGDSIIMFSDSTDDYPPLPASLFIYVRDADESFKKAIDNGAAEIMKMSDQPYGRSGGVTDAFGNKWWITSEKKID